MDNFNHVKEVWMQTDVSALPASENVIKTIKKIRIKSILKSASLIVATAALMSVMVYVVLFYKSTMITTRIGEACFLIAMFILLNTSARSLKRISARRNSSNNDFITYLKDEQQRQIYFFRKTQIIGLRKLKMQKEA